MRSVVASAILAIIAGCAATSPDGVPAESALPESAPPPTPGTPACTIDIETCRGSDCDAWVHVKFDILSSGQVTNPAVLSACPPDHFNEAVLKAVRAWRYKPMPDPRHGVEVVIKFKLPSQPETPRR